MNFHMKVHMKLNTSYIISYEIKIIQEIFDEKILYRNFIGNFVVVKNIREKNSFHMKFHVKYMTGNFKWTSLQVRPSLQN